MARKRKSPETGEEEAKTRRGLEPAYSGKVGGNKYVVYCDHRKEGWDHPKVLILSFAAKYSAHYFIKKLINGEDFEECEAIGGRKGVITSSGIRITMFGDDLLMLLTYEPTGEEVDWTDDQINKSVLQFKYGRAEGQSRISRDDNGEDDEQRATADAPTAPKPKREKPVKEPKVRVDTTGYVSANDIGAKLKVHGRDVRAALRSLKLEKPSHGWSWPKKEASEIEAQIVEQLKKDKKKKK